MVGLDLPVLPPWRDIGGAGGSIWTGKRLGCAPPRVIMPSMSWSITVPATLSNLGPGFDVLGLAIDLANRFDFERVGSPGEYRVGDRSVAPQDDLVCQTVERAFAAFGGRATTGLRVDQEERIPRERGMGSSATARVAGLAAWAWLTGERIELSDALSFLAGEEGHPDNVVPAMVGGLAASTRVDGQLHHIRLRTLFDFQSSG